MASAQQTRALSTLSGRPQAHSHLWTTGFPLRLLTSMCGVPGLVLALLGCHPQTALEAAQPGDGHVHAHSVQKAHAGALKRGWERRGSNRGASWPLLQWC